MHPSSALDCRDRSRNWLEHIEVAVTLRRPFKQCQASSHPRKIRLPVPHAGLPISHSSILIQAKNLPVFFGFSCSDHRNHSVRHLKPPQKSSCRWFRIVEPENYPARFNRKPPIAAPPSPAYPRCSPAIADTATLPSLGFRKAEKNSRASPVPKAGSIS